jgi:hypothetical protein
MHAWEGADPLIQTVQPWPAARIGVVGVRARARARRRRSNRADGNRDRVGQPIWGSRCAGVPRARTHCGAPRDQTKSPSRSWLPGWVWGCGVLNPRAHARTHGGVPTTRTIRLARTPRIACSTGAVRLRGQVVRVARTHRSTEPTRTNRRTSQSRSREWGCPGAGLFRRAREHGKARANSAGLPGFRCWRSLVRCFNDPLELCLVGLGGAWERGLGRGACVGPV